MSFGTGLTPPDPEPFPSALAHPVTAAGATIPSAHHGQPALALPRARRTGMRPVIWVVGLLVLAFVGLAGYFLEALGGAATAVGLVVALVPFAGVIAAVRFVDRWEPEPRGLVILALAWGAIAALGLALLVDYWLNGVFAPSPVRDVLRAVVQAPVIEELGKGLGVLLIFLTARRAFDGPVDGVVYGALVGAGFAFTENIQYFALAVIEGGAQQLSATFFVRGVLSPFAHAMFTAITGFALGLVARRGGGAAAAMGPWLAGLAGAILLHGFWNWSATFEDFFSLYMTLQVPLFVGFIVGIIALRREEGRLTRLRLGEYAAAGWFTPQEVDMLATPSGRREALAWAASLRGDRRGIMKGFIRDATALAAARQRALSGRDTGAAEEEHIMLTRISTARQALLSY